METNSNGMMDTSNQPDIKPDINRLNASAAQAHGYVTHSMAQSPAFPAAAAYASLAGSPYYPGMIVLLSKFKICNITCFILRVNCGNIGLRGCLVKREEKCMQYPNYCKKPMFYHN